MDDKWKKNVHQVRQFEISMLHISNQLGQRNMAGIWPAFHRQLRQFHATNEFIENIELADGSEYLVGWVVRVCFRVREYGRGDGLITLFHFNIFTNSNFFTHTRFSQSFKFGSLEDWRKRNSGNFFYYNFNYKFYFDI